LQKISKSSKKNYFNKFFFFNKKNIQKSLITGMLECVLFSGPILGWSSLVFIYKLEYFFDENCANEIAQKNELFKNSTNTTPSNNCTYDDAVIKKCAIQEFQIINIFLQIFNLLLLSNFLFFLRKWWQNFHFFLHFDQFSWQFQILVNYSILANLGNYSILSNLGNYSILSNLTNYSILANLVNYSISANSGNYSILANLAIIQFWPIWEIIQFGQLFNFGQFGQLFNFRQFGQFFVQLSILANYPFLA